MQIHFIGRSIRESLSYPPLAREARHADICTMPDVHLDAAVSWLIRSIDVCGGQGSSKGYRFLDGWMRPYPETSGYIIPTLLMLERERLSGAYRTRAEAIARWLVSIQLPDGGYAGREIGVQTKPDVFDTGMILLGLNALLHQGKRAFLEPARKAASFLLCSMDDDGCFARNLSHDLLHAYNVRSAWALVAFGMLTGDSRFTDAGMANARWTRAQQQAKGNFLNNAFKPGGNANTHGIAYVLQGLLQIHDLTRDQDCLDSVLLAANALKAVLRTQGRLAAELGPEWQFLSRHLCLTGYAQLAIVFYRLFQITEDRSYREAADGLVAGVARIQSLRSPSKPYYGGIAGSFPIYGRYAPLQYPNLATKFFIDALLARARIDRGEKGLAQLQLYAG